MTPRVASRLRRVALWTVGIAATVVLATGALGAYLAPSDNVETADAIVVISGGGNERIEQGIRLYHEGRAPKLVLSGDARDPRSPSNAESMRAAAIAAGVPAEAILVEPASRTTLENAQHTRALLEDSAGRIILVTSTYHQRRALQAFRAEYGRGVEILNAPATVPFYTPWTWWRTERGRRLFMAEYGKLIYVRFTGKHARTPS